MITYKKFANFRPYIRASPPGYLPCIQNNQNGRKYKNGQNCKNCQNYKKMVKMAKMVKEIKIAKRRWKKVFKLPEWSKKPK